MTTHQEALEVGEETPAEEFSRLIIEFNEGERQNRVEAWNLIADFACEHSDAIIRGFQAADTITALQADRTAQAAEIERLKAERDELRAYAERLARQLHFKHYEDNPGWKPLSGDLIGLLTQIDNMTSGLERAETAEARLSARCWIRRWRRQKPPFRRLRRWL